MARMLDAVYGSAESGSTSEQRVEEHNPQPYRVGFEQFKLRVAQLLYILLTSVSSHIVQDRTGMTIPIVVKAYIVPALRHDLLSAKGLNNS
jgi:hypothetical protein